MALLFPLSHRSRFIILSPFPSTIISKFKNKARKDEDGLEADAPVSGH